MSIVVDVSEIEDRSSSEDSKSLQSLNANYHFIGQYIL